MHIIVWVWKLALGLLLEHIVVLSSILLSKATFHRVLILNPIALENWRQTLISSSEILKVSWLQISNRVCGVTHYVEVSRWVNSVNRSIRV